MRGTGRLDPNLACLPREGGGRQKAMPAERGTRRAGTEWRMRAKRALRHAAAGLERSVAHVGAGGLRWSSAGSSQQRAFCFLWRAPRIRAHPLEERSSCRSQFEVEKRPDHGQGQISDSEKNVETFLGL